MKLDLRRSRRRLPVDEQTRRSLHLRILAALLVGATPVLAIASGAPARRALVRTRLLPAILCSAIPLLLFSS